MSLTIRKATAEDAPEVARVHIQSWLETYTGIVPQSHLDTLSVERRTASWAAHLQQPEPAFDMYLGLMDGQVCGIAAAGKKTEKDPAAAPYEAEVILIYVLQSAKGKGLGRLLMENAAEVVRKEGLKGAMLWVLEENASTGFYEHLGAKVVSRKTDVIAGQELSMAMYGWDEFDV